MKKLAKFLCLAMVLSSISLTASAEAETYAYGTFTVDGVTFYAKTSATRAITSLVQGGERVDTTLKNAFDGNPDTVWVANTSGTRGHWVELDFGEKKLLGGFKYQAVQQSSGNGDYAGAFGNYKIEVSNDGEHYTRTALSYVGWSKDVQELKTDTVYARYMRLSTYENASLSFNGTGAAELAPIVVEADTEAKPTAQRLEIHGTAMSGETLTAKYLYNSTAGIDEKGTKYVWYTSGTKDGEYKDVAFGNTEDGIKYTVKEKDAGKYLILAIIPKDKNGTVGGKVWSNPVKILTEDEKTAVADAVASFDTQATELTKENLVITGTSTDIALPTIENAAITWKNDNTAYLSETGKVIKRSNFGNGSDTCAYPDWEKDGIVKSTYTASISVNGIDFTRDMCITIQPEGTQPGDETTEETTYPSWKLDAEDGYTNMGLEVKTESGNKAYYRTLEKSGYGYYEMNWVPVCAYRESNDSWHNINTWHFWKNTVGSITADTVWIGREFVKADPTGEKTEGEIQIGAVGIGAAPADVHRVSYPTGDITINSTDWTELQMVGNLGSDSGYTRLGFLAYGGVPSAIYIDNIELQELRIGSIDLQGDDTVEAGAESTYSGTVLNQFGTTLGMEEITKVKDETEYKITPKQTVSFSLKTPKDGVSINAETGKLTVAENVKPGEVTVVAKISTPTGFVGANGNVNDLKGRNVTAEKTVEILNSNPFAISGRLVDGETLAANRDATWYIGKNPEGDFEEIGTGTQITVSNAGGKYVKAVSGICTDVVYIEPKISTDAMFVYKDGARKADLKFETGTLKAVAEIVNNTAAEKTTVAIIAVYENGKLTAVVKGTPVNVPGNGEANVEASLAVTADENITAKIMVVNNGTYEPYGKATTLK